MRCYEFVSSGSAFAVQVVPRPEPTVAAGRVIVRVRAVSLNYRDLIHLRNEAGRNVAGRIPLSDGAGYVVAIGAGVASVKVGDRVAGIFFTDWLGGRFEMKYHPGALGGATADGMMTEYADLAADAVVPIPDHLTYEEAACLPCAGVTAWSALMNHGGLSPDDVVLILGTGGVSIFALQLANAVGCRVIGTSSSDAKRERLRELGCRDSINYRTTPDWEKEVARLTEKRGVDCVVEVGGGGTLGKSMASVAAGGRIALIGVLTGFGPPSDSLFPIVAKNATLNGIYVGSRTDFVAMNAFLAAKAIRPIIDRTFPFDAFAESLEYLATGSHFGKVVLTL